MFGGSPSADIDYPGSSAVAEHLGNHCHGCFLGCDSRAFNGFYCNTNYFSSADTVGKKKMMVLSMALVLVGSLIGPWGGITTVIIGRALQGLGTALVPVAMSVMRDELPGHRMSGELSHSLAQL